MPKKKTQEISAAQLRLARQAGLTRSKNPKQVKLSLSEFRTLKAVTPSKEAKTRNVFAKLTPAQVRGIRRDKLENVLPGVKSGVFVRVPKGAKSVKVSVKPGEVVTAWTERGKRYRRVDTPMQTKDWVGVDSREFAQKGKKPKERLKKITVAVAGYDSTNRYTPRSFANYITRDFGPRIRSARKKQSNFSVRRLYVSNTGKTKRTSRRA